MMQRRAFLAAAGALAAAIQIPFAKAKGQGATSAACNPPVVPSSTKSRFAPLISGKTPGTLLSREDIAVSISGARAWRVRYISKDVNGVLHEVSGLVPRHHRPRRCRLPVSPAGPGTRSDHLLRHHVHSANRLRRARPAGVDQ